MVESFLGKNKGSNFIEGTKIMKNFSDNNKNGSSIFQGKIREQDFSAEQKLNELKAAIEELDRQEAVIHRLDLMRRILEKDCKNVSLHRLKMEVVQENLRKEVLYHFQGWSR